MFLALSPSIEPNIQTAGQNTVRRININPNLLNSNDQQGSVIRKSLIKSPYEQTQRMIQSTARQRPAIKLETEIDNLQSIASRNTQSRPRQVSKVNLISMHKAYAGDSIRSGNFAKKKLSRFNVNTAKYGIQNLVNNSIFGHNNEIKPFFTKEIIIRN